MSMTVTVSEGVTTFQLPAPSTAADGDWIVLAILGGTCAGETFALPS